MMDEFKKKYEREKFTKLSRISGVPVDSLRKIIVTEQMKKAAMEYYESLSDKDLWDFNLEDIYIVMASLHPKTVGRSAETLLLSQ